LTFNIIVSPFDRAQSFFAPLSIVRLSSAVTAKQAGAFSGNYSNIYVQKEDLDEK
jgi:hypothetical protein